jgi:beta-glucosidase
LSTAAIAVAALTSFSCGESTSTTPSSRVPPDRRADEILRRIRPDEKLALLRGAATLSWEGNTRLGIPPLRAVPGPMGISLKDVPATAFPANIGIAATWNPELTEQIGKAIAQQARALGRGQVLGPILELNHSPLSGRTFESYGENPFLASRIANSYIEGVQGEGAIATAIFRGSIDDTRASRESDLHLLESAVAEGGVWAIKLRDAVQPDRFLHGELGFRGFRIFTSPNDVYDVDDEQVRGVLRAMFASGVYDHPPKASGKVETPEHRDIARKAAEESIVLLKNDGGLLPIDRGKVHKIAVLGSNAAVNRMASGSYTVDGRYGPAPLDALRNALGSSVVSQVNTPAEAADADLAIVFAGTGAATEGETIDRPSLDLPGNQDDLIASVAKANPHTIVVITAGSPVAMDKWLKSVPAVLDAWFPGEVGGDAIADILTGKLNPSGRLPIAFPSLFPFGFGLSYTTFDYTDLEILPWQTPPGQFFEVSVNVRNAGSRAGKETVQLYFHEISSKQNVTRPPQELRAFQQIGLKPGESKRVSFTMPPTSTTYFDENRRDWVQDQAVFEVRVGSSSEDIRGTGRFEVTE